MIAFLRHQKLRDPLVQIAFVGGVVLLIVGGALSAQRNLAERGLTSGFGFLFKSTGWEVHTAILSVSGMDPYWWFFLVGLANTLLLGVIGLILATAVGAVIGLARSSNNDLARLLGTSYVEVFRNIPLILQVFFWHAVMTHLPGPRQALEFGGALLTGRGLYLPAPNLAAWALAGLAGLGLAAGAAALVLRGRRRLGLLGVLAVLGLALVLAGHSPQSPFWDRPALAGLNIRGGLRIAPELAALALAMAIYGGAYIGEIVRGGFKSVGPGQIEAARALGLAPWHVFTRVQLPLALRAMLPILANQYVWLIKATTLGITIGFADFFMMIAMTINHSGQTLEAILLLMAGFLAINFTIAAVFNRINRAIALKGNQLRS